MKYNKILTATLSHLPAETIRELEAITQTILATGLAEQIILFGSYARGDFKTKRGALQGKQSDYDILVIVAEYTHCRELQHALHSAFAHIATPVQYIVEDSEFVNDKLKDGQYFFSDIKREGKVLFDSGKIVLAEAQTLLPTRRREIAEKDFKEWYKSAEEFYIGHQDAYRRKFYKKASFELQQCVEMCYTTLEMVYSHYNPHEHNLHILRKRVTQFTPQITIPFPLATTRQQDLFEQLNFAYIGGRYRSDEEFPVTEAQLNYWREETEKLLAITKAICINKIKSFTE